MRRRHMILGSAAALSVGACGGPSKFKRYNGPEVTYVIVKKGERRMYLLHQDKVLEQYEVKLGFAPEGHKEHEGDGRTPEGIYRIDRRNPNSKFHLSVGISYPNADDIAKAAAMGRRAGGDIFIHGQEKPGQLDDGDWTWGCISVSNEEIENIYAMVKDGTPIAIYP